MSRMTADALGLPIWRRLVIRTKVDVWFLFPNSKIGSYVVLAVIQTDFVLIEAGGVF